MTAATRRVHSLFPTVTDHHQFDELSGVTERAQEIYTAIERVLESRKKRAASRWAFVHIANEDEPAPVGEASAIVVARPSLPRARAYGSSMAITGPAIRHSRLQRKILDLYKRVRRGNWDGEGAHAVSEETINIAQTIVTEFPSDIGDPDISASPRGDIDFDWVAKDDVMLTISVVSSGKIVFALMLGDFHSSGTKESWEGTLPDFFDCCFEHLRRA